MSTLKLLVRGSVVEILECPFLLNKHLLKKYTFTFKDAFFMKRAMESKRPGSSKWFDGKKRFIYKDSFRVGLLPGVLEEVKAYSKDIVVDIVESTPILECIDTKLELNTITLRDYQQECVDILIENKVGIVKVATNGGKSIIMSAFLQKYRHKTIILIHRDELVTQLYTTLTSQTTLKIGKLIAGEKTDGDVVICMVKTLLNRLEICDEFATQLLAETTCICVDECQHSVSKTFSEIIQRCEGVTRVFGFSGTPFKSDEPMDIMTTVEQVGPVIAEIRNDTLIKKGVSAKTFIKLVHHNAHMLPSSIDYQTAYQLGIEDNVERNTMIINILKANKDLKGLIVVNTIMHGDELSYMADEAGIQGHVFLHGQVDLTIRRDTLQDYKDGKYKYIIATTIFDEGIDISSINFIVLAAGGKSAIRLLQRIGRGIRKKDDNSALTVYDFYDSHNIYLLEHLQERFKIYMTEGCFETEEVFSV